MRLEGFDDEVYKTFLESLDSQNPELSGRPLEVRTTGPISGKEAFAIPSGKTPTLYRNNVRPGYALLLIFNEYTSDAQSLKDIFALTETRLSREGLDRLIGAAFEGGFKLTEQEAVTLRTFIERLRKNLFEPQLRSLTEFLLQVNDGLVSSRHSSVGSAIADSLDKLRIFRCREVADHLNSPRGDKLLKDSYDAARLGEQLLEDRRLGDFKSRLDNADFSDDRAQKGASPQQKKRALQNFLFEVGGGEEALKIDWQEVSKVLFKKSKTGSRSTQEKLKQSAAEVKGALGRVELETSDLSPDEQEAINDLERGVQPNADELTSLISEREGALGKSLMKRLQKLAGVRSTESTKDFVSGLTKLSLELLGSYVEPSSEAIELTVKPKDGQFSDDHPDTEEAAAAFRVLYAGIESLMPSVSFELTELYEAADRHFSQLDSGADGSHETTDSVNITFQVRVASPSGGQSPLQAELEWNYPLDSLAADTLANLLELSDREGSECLLPVYYDKGGLESFGDINLDKPRWSFGRWYDDPRDLRVEFVGKVERRPGARRKRIDAVAGKMHVLAERVSSLARQALTDGLLGADVFDFIEEYDRLLSEASQQLTYDVEATYGFRELNQAFMIRSRDINGWAIATLVHPIKLLWWRNRAAQYGEFIAERSNTEQPSGMIDDRRFSRELERMYGSSGTPAILSLPVGAESDLYLPIEEQSGYELFQPTGTSATQLPSPATTDDKASAQEAALQLAKVVENYVQTYPFVEQGLEVHIVECQNSLLPGELVEKLEHRRPHIRLSVIVHTRSHGAEIFRRVSEWLSRNERFQERPAESYFPRISLKVLEKEDDSAFNMIEDTDLVILADVLSFNGQSIEAELESITNEMPPQNFLSFPTTRPTPFGEGDEKRKLQLTPLAQPSVMRRFYNAQYGSHEEKPAPDDKAARFSLINSLKGRRSLLQKLHAHFNWVVCYDTVADRFLLRNTMPNNSVQVIRYSTGLGTTGTHNLTVSSASATRDIVSRRLVGKLSDMFTTFTHENVKNIAEYLIDQANELSGDIVLRAAGPGAYLNELIGLVLTKRLTEREYNRAHNDTLQAWIYLDDYSGWFNTGNKYPDLVFIGIDQSQSGTIRLNAQVAEAKCVSAGGFAKESEDAQRQALEGVARLGEAWKPKEIGESTSLDAPYWRDQLLRAVAANLSIRGEEQSLWEWFQRALAAGTYDFDFSGHAWVFCHDDQASISANETDYGELSDISPEDGSPLFKHLFGRDNMLSLLMEAKTDLPKNPTGESSTLGGGAKSGLTSTASASKTEHSHREVSSAEQGMSDEAFVGTDGSLPSTESTSSPTEVEQQGLEEIAPKDEGVQDTVEHAEHSIDEAWLAERSRDIDRVLHQYSIKAYEVDPAAADVGPSIIRFKVRLRSGERIGRLQSVSEDIGRELALQSVPLIDNVYGSNYVSIDLPRPTSETIPLQPLLKELSPPAPSELPFVLGKTPNGRVLVEDLSDFPHLLVGGATNSGKSVFLRSLLLCLMELRGPDELSLLIVDPKRTDFSFFNATPEYLIENKVITDQEEARDALLSLVHEEMPRRQELMMGRSMKIKDFNERFPEEALKPIVAVIDEYAQLLSIMGKKERENFERDLMSLAAVARATGIHLVLATQRPSADIVTGSLKANLPAGIAFKVAGSVNSRIVIDQAGAENLLGRGDMLFKQPSGETMRLQAAFLDEASLQEHLVELKDRHNRGVG